MKLVGVGTGEQQQILNDPGHQGCRPIRAFQGAAVFGGRLFAAQCHAGAGFDRGERGLELVRGIGGKSTLLLEGHLQAGQHCIEGGGEPGELIVPRYRQSPGEIGSSKPGSGQSDLPYRCEETLRQDIRSQLVTEGIYKKITDGALVLYDATAKKLAGLFRDTAEGETGHAHGHLDFLKEVGDPATGEPIGNTSKNLKAAIAGETYEYTEMYPGFARTAREEGFDEIAEWFETLARAEKSHAGRFQKGLDTIS